VSVRIAPSILSADFSRLAESLASIEEAADLVHLDVMDGHFVPNITIGPPVIRALRKVTRLPFDCHLMIAEPQRYIAEFVAAGAQMISIHIEAEPHLHRALSMIRDGGALAGICLNPATPAESLTDALAYADYVVVMSVNPGFGGQKFIDVTGKIQRIRSMIERIGRPIDIEVDGGVDATTAAAVVRAGANILVAGNAVFGTGSPAENIAQIRNASAVLV
jgi:ribulose-phosphate 3-epimerase